MYASDVEEQTLTFAVSGKLWNRSLVMIDSETKTLWSHILGEAMEGELKGTHLETIPSVFTDWKSWRRDHPGTTVLNMRRTAERFQTDFFKRPEQYVIGMGEGQPKAYSFAELKRQPVVNDVVDDTPVLIVFDATSGTAWTYDRRIGDQTLQFAMGENNIVRDAQTGSQWHYARGIATKGELKDERLTPVVNIISYTKAWRKFHPDTEMWQAEPTP